MIYGRAKSFMDRFNDDKHALRRVQNPYYPFADQEEWELGSFLLRSGMSMQKMDEFLRLKLVFNFLAYPLHCLLTNDPDQAGRDHVPYRKDLRGRIEMLPDVPEWKFKSVSLTGQATKQPNAPLLPRRP
jgi:hypothetical protein